MSVEAQSIWQMFVIDQRRKTHNQKEEKMEKVVMENPEVEKTEKEIH